MVLRAALPLLLAVSLAACAQTFDATSVGVPVTLASPAGQPASGSPFTVSSKAVFGLWGIVGLRQPSLRKALAAQLGGGGGVADAGSTPSLGISVSTTCKSSSMRLM